MNTVRNGVDVLGALCFRVGIVVTKEDEPTVLVCCAQRLERSLEVQVHALRVADVEVSIRLWREASADATTGNFGVFLHLHM